MKLSEFANASDRDYCDLQHQIDTLPQQISLGFDDCELPAGCMPRRATVGFYKESATGYAMYLDGNAQYSGCNQALGALCEKHQIFHGFDEMKRFLCSLPAEPSPPLATPAEPSTVSPNTADAAVPNNVVNISELTLPTGSVRAEPDRTAIQCELEKSIMGQDEAVETMAHQVALHLRKNNPKKPLSIVCYGPPGTGKSEIAKLLPKILSKLGAHQYAEVWTDLNQFTEVHSVYRLIGSPPGYLGYDDKSIFEAVTQNPYSVFIWDEIEKAHPEVLKTMMAILDEGRCASRKALPDGSREYNFKNCIFIFTSNLQLGKTSPERKIGFSISSDVEDIRNKDNTIEVSYCEKSPGDEYSELTRRIYRNTEAARKAFVSAGNLREIASRFNCFIEFKELSDEAKINILVKQVIETGFEYNIRLAQISPEVMQELINASMSESSLTVRSFKSVIEGYLAEPFAQAAASGTGQPVRLEGDLNAPKIYPV